MRKRLAGEMKKKMRRGRRQSSLLSVPINGKFSVCHTMDCILTAPLIQSSVHGKKRLTNINFFSHQANGWEGNLFKDIESIFCAF